MSSADDVLKGMQKQFGKEVIAKGTCYHTAERVPTGVFPFDLATGGGFPRGRMSICYGPESSLKTTMALLAIADEQRRHPERKCVLVDVEASYDPEWGAILGVDNDKLIYSLPDYAEQAVDIVEGLLYAEDIGVVVIDSLAALTTANELDSSAEKAVVGGSGLVIGKLVRKAVVALSKARKEERTPTFIAINQIRMKIGVMFGDPETMPGGNAPRFASSLTVRMYGKDEIDKSINPVLPAWKKCTGIVKKWKVPIVARNFEFKLVTLERKGFKVGQADDWNTIQAYLKELELMVKDGKNYSILGIQYKTITAFKNKVLAEPKFSDYVRGEIIKYVMGTDQIDAVDEVEGVLEDDL